MAFTEGALPVGRPDLTASNGCDEVQANTSGLPPVCGTHKVVKTFARSNFKKTAKKNLTFIDECYLKKIDSWLHYYI